MEDTDDDDDEQKLSGAGKQMRKMLKKNDKSGQYDDSDDDKNPYASSVCCRSSLPLLRFAHLRVNRRRKRKNLTRPRFIRGRRFRPHHLAQDHSNQVRRVGVFPGRQIAR